MEKIAYTDSHTLWVDPAKNRIYCTMSGNEFPEQTTFVQDWKKAAQLVSHGFTALVDVTRFRIMSLGWIETALKTQKILRDAGLAATAEIVPEHVFIEMESYGILDMSGFEERKIFVRRDEAEAWLDAHSVTTYLQGGSYARDRQNPHLHVNR